MVHYIIQMLVFQCCFLALYDFLLKKETFFNYNRGYLIFTLLLSLLLPFVKIASFAEVLPNSFSVLLPEVVIGTKDTGLAAQALDPVVLEAAESRFQWHWWYLLVLGSLWMLGRFIYKLSHIGRLVIGAKKIKKDGTTIVKLSKSMDAFSFFGYVFLGEELQDSEQAMVMKHELVHVKQKHSWDLLFIEAQKIVFWFNPCLYIYQNRLRAIHEYIADNEALKSENKRQYCESLLSQMFDTQNVSFINSFYKESLIKKRIVMLQKSQSKPQRLFKYLVLVPLICSMLIYTSCVNESMAQEAMSGDSSAIIEKVEELREELAKKGNVSDEEEKALKGLLMLVEEDGVTKAIFQDAVDYAKIPFGVIDKIPTYKECESLDGQDERNCVNTKVGAFITNSFNMKIAERIPGLKGVQRINASFVIDSKGNVQDIKVRAEYPELAEEAKRVIGNLPQMIPGEQKGVKVSVAYSLPIAFQIGN